MDMRKYAKTDSKVQFKNLGIGEKFSFNFKFGDLNTDLNTYEKTSARKYKDAETDEEILIGSITCPVVRK